MNYKQRYNKAMSKMDELIKKYTGTIISSDDTLYRDLQNVFPELKETEEKPNGGIVLEDFNEGDGFYKVNLAYLSKEQVEEIESIVKKWNHKSSESDEIRKELIEHFRWNTQILNDFDNRKVITWLEEQKPLENYDETEKEKIDFVGNGFVKCHADFLDFKEGNTYWLEYIGDDKYNVRSDNLLGKTYHITPCQLYTGFKKQTWLEKQCECQELIEKGDCAVEIEPLQVNKDEQESDERKDFISIPFGTDSELINETITIPDGCTATLDGNKIHINKISTDKEDKESPKAINEETDNNTAKDFESNYESNINVGDWVVRKDGETFRNGSNAAQVNKIQGALCYLDTGRWLYDFEIRPWSIKDGKDGDVLCYKDEISLYKHAIINCTEQGITFGGFVYHCCYDGKRFITDSLYSLAEQDKMDIYPATKEQRNLLFQKMKESGYTWDSKKELIRI